jgi:hypothetical protein
MEHEKLRSFSVRVAPRSIGRRLQLMSRISGELQQEILRKIIEKGLDKAYAAMIAQGANLPPAMAVASMSDAQFNALVAPMPRKGPKLTKASDRVPA